jgi:hypothetical protein
MKNLLIAVLLVVGCGLLSYADIVHLKSGKTVEGKVLASNSTTVMVQDEFGGIVNVPKDTIRDIETVSNVPGSTNSMKANTVKKDDSSERGKALPKPQPSDDFDESARNVISIGGGLANLGIGSIGSITIGYDYYLLQNLSFGFFLSIWPGYNAVAAIYDVSCLVHFVGKKSFDPYIGIGFANMAISTSSKTYIDIPFVVGFNAWVNNNFGFKLQDKIYLLSLSAAFLNELTAQLVFAF